MSFSLSDKAILILMKVKKNEKSRFVSLAIENMGEGLPEHNKVVAMYDNKLVSMEQLKQFNINLNGLIKARGG